MIFDYYSEDERTCSDDDNSAEEPDFCIGKAKPVNSLGQLKDRVHQELCIARGHARDCLPFDDIPVQTDQALKRST